MRFAPGEEGRVADQAIFEHFGIARGELARIERVEQRRIDHHQGGRVEGADEIFLPGGIDRGLAADCAVGLGEQGGRNMNYRAAALVEGGGEAGDIADRTATEGNDRGAAADFALGQAIDDRGEGAPVFRRFAFGKKDRRLEADWGEFGPVELEQAGVGNEKKWLAAAYCRNAIQRLRQVADHDIFRERVGHAAKWRSSATRIRSTTS